MVGVANLTLSRLTWQESLNVELSTQSWPVGVVTGGHLDCANWCGRHHSLGLGAGPSKSGEGQWVVSKCAGFHFCLFLPVDVV